MKKLPIGIQTFSTIIEENYTYVDKTAMIHTMITAGKYYFLSRPRRFGKSLLVSTLAEIFSGNRALFKGLAIDSLEYDWKKYPVIKISLTSVPCATPEEFVRGLQAQLQDRIDEHSINLLQDSPPARMLEKLVLELSKKEKVVLLIDEYDFPILRHINDKEMAIKMREEVRSFYAVIKDLGDYLKFAFFTGVSKFSKVSLFSELNHLNDITAEERYATLCGYTQQELEACFSEYIDEFMASEKLSRSELLAKLKFWYNGFQFTKKGTKVYNPFSILNSFSKKDFHNYWFASGTSRFIMDFVEKNPSIVNQLIMLEAQEVDSGDFEVFSVETYFKNILILFYQAGYLTIGSYDGDKDTYQLVYPNNEVRLSMTKQLFNFVANIENVTLSRFVEKFRKSF